MHTCQVYDRYTSGADAVLLAHQFEAGLGLRNGRVFERARRVEHLLRHRYHQCLCLCRRQLHRRRRRRQAHGQALANVDGVCGRGSAEVDSAGGRLGEAGGVERHRVGSCGAANGDGACGRGGSYLDAYEQQSDIKRFRYR